MKLSDLNPDDIQTIQSSASPENNAPLRLSDLNSEDIQTISPAKKSLITPEMHSKFQKGQDQSDAILKGVTSGAMLGGEGVLGGAIQSGLDLGQAGLNKLGLASPSPTQVNAQLASQGATGNIGPTGEKDLYYQGKHETNADFDATQAKNPKLFGAAQLAGGLALPLGSAVKGAQGATAAARIGNAALSGVKTGAAVGAGAGFLGGRSDLGGAEANPLGVAKDVAIGTALGAGTGGLLGGGASALSEGAQALTGGWKNLAANRAAAAMNLNSEKNMGPVARADNAIKQGYSAGQADAKPVGQTLLEQDALPSNPFASKKTIQDKLQSKINNMESELDPMLDNIQENTTGKAADQEQSFLEKAKQYKKFLDMQKSLAKHVPEPAPTAAQDAQAALPSASGDIPPVSSEQISPTNIPNTEAIGDTGGLDTDTVNQLRQQLNPIEQQHANVQGENPGIDLAEQLSPQPENPMQMGSGESTTLLPKANLVEPEAPLGVLNKQALGDKFDEIANNAISEFNPNLPRSGQVIAKLKSDSDVFKQQVIDAANDPMKLNALKRDLYKEAEMINQEAYVPGKELPPQAKAEINLRKAQANAVKTQIEALGDQLEPGLGKKIANTNASIGNLVAASKGLNKTKPAVTSVSDLLSPIKTATKAIIGRPADILAAKAANAMPGMAGDASQFAAGTSLPGSIAGKQVEQNIYNRNNAVYKEYAQKLLSNPQYAHIGNKLNKALQENNSIERAQALFLIQQTAGARTFLDNKGGQ